MTTTYFNAERAVGRFYYVQGITSDEFYTDSGMKVNLEWLLFQELKRNGYERVIFYDSNWKLYCYDDDSFSLMLNGRMKQDNSQQQMTTISREKVTGLKMGKWKSKRTNTEKINLENAQKQAVEIEEEKVDTQTIKTIKGEASQILMKQYLDTDLHSGMENDEVIFRQIDAYMNDKTIKTAIIFNDANDFITGIGAFRHHNLNIYNNLPADNQNILIFIFSNKNTLGILDMRQIDQQRNFEDLVKFSNIINICYPNALELKNMLNYFRLSSDLILDKKRVNLKIKMSDIQDIALEMRRYMTDDQEYPVGIKVLYHKLLQFAQSGEKLTLENCYKVFGTQKHLTGREQLQQLIGLQKIKSEIERFESKSSTSEEKTKYLTSSRLRPDFPVPENSELMHIVLTGNPGTGKTTVAKLLGQLYYEMGYLSNGNVVETDRQGLVAGYVGQTAIKTRQKVEEALGGVLFIDEAYALKREEQSGGDFGQEAIDTLVKSMDEFKGQFILIVAGYKREMDVFLNANQGLKSRFRLELNIEDYTPKEMQELLNLYLKKKKLVLSEQLQQKIEEFCENWVNLSGENWGNAREAVKLADDLSLNWKNDSKREKKEIADINYGVVEERHFPSDKQKYLSSIEEMRGKALENLNALIGLKYVKQQIKKIRNRMIMKDKNEPGHYIFSGNPGTGKTTVARYMGGILRNHGMLKRGHLEEYTAGRLVDEIKKGNNFLDLAQKAIGGVLFIDEAHQLLDTVQGRHIMRDLVPFMENNREEVCVICAGYEEDMERFLDYDTGFKDRFSEVILFENYTGRELQAILISKLKEDGYEPDDDYKEYSLRALTRYVGMHGKDKNFGNGRYIRTKYIPASLDARTNRLLEKYGGNDIPEGEKKKLTGEDIPIELVKYTKEKLPEKDTRSAMEKVEDLIGYAEIKKELKKLLDSAQYRKEDGTGAKLVPETLHWVLKGNPGTGKTTIANLVGEVYKECGLLSKGHTIKVTRSNLVAEYEGQTAPKTRRVIEQAMDGVLFIDEAYSLTKGHTHNNDSDFGKEAIDEIVEAMTDRNGEFAVIAAGYPNDMDEFLQSNEGLLSRFKVFTLEDYTPEELHQILLLKCKEAYMEISPDLDKKLDTFFANYKERKFKQNPKSWGNGREVENLLRAIQHEWFKHPITEQHEDEVVHRIITEEHLPSELRRYLKEKRKKTENHKTALEQIRSLIGFSEIKQYLEDLLELGIKSQEEGMEDLIEDLNLHLVLEGNPGTGKTKIANLIGLVYKEIGLLNRGHCVKVTRDKLVSQYSGETAIKTKRKIEEAMGGVLFIDEAYTLMREGEVGNTFGSYGQEAIDTILEAMTDRNGEFAVIVAGYPREMRIFLNSNPGFISRFNENIFIVEDYTEKELAEIFKFICRERNFQVSEELEKQLVPMFENMKKNAGLSWGNAREVENLEKKMRTIWSKNPVNKKDGDFKIREYGIEHIPPKYQKYLSNI